MGIARGERTLSGEETLQTLIARGLVVGRNLRLGHGSPNDYNPCWVIEIGDEAIVGAGSVVTKDISRTVAVGSPARPIMDVEDSLDRGRADREDRPFFDARYTLSGGITPEMRHEQKRVLANGEGFVV